MVQWLGLHASTAGDRGLIPGRGTKISHATQRGQRKYIHTYIHIYIYKIHMYVCIYLNRSTGGFAKRCVAAAAAAAKSLQSCPTLCDPIDGSPPGSAVPGILQARTLEWVAISFSNAWKWKVKVKTFSCVQRLGTPRTSAYQALPSMGLSRQEYWSELPLPSPKDV